MTKHSLLPTLRLLQGDVGYHEPVAPVVSRAVNRGLGPVCVWLMNNCRRIHGVNNTSMLGEPGHLITEKQHRTG